MLAPSKKINTGSIFTIVVLVFSWLNLDPVLCAWLVNLYKKGRKCLVYFGIHFYEKAL